MNTVIMIITPLVIVKGLIMLAILGAILLFLNYLFPKEKELPIVYGIAPQDDEIKHLRLELEQNCNEIESLRALRKKDGEQIINLQMREKGSSKNPA